MSKVRIGVIGLKGMGRTHIREIVQSERAELVAVADLDQDAARAVGEEHGVSVWSDYREMIASEDLDAAVIATPHHLHAPMGLHCLEAGLHTFVEKPIANTVSEADRMIDAAESRGLKLAVGHNYRTFPGNRALKRLIDEGAIGDIYRVLWMWLETRPEAYYERDIWRCTWAQAGGGGLMNQTSHDLDLLCWLVGEPVEVSAMVSNWSHNAEIEDTAIGSIRFACGASCNVQLSICDRRLNYRQISGDRGTIEYRDEKNANSHVPDVFRLGRYEAPMREFIRGKKGGAAVQPQVTWEDVEAEAGGPSLLESFIGSILDGTEPITDGRTARRTLELINAMVLSGVRKEVVSLPLDRGRYDELMEELKSGKTSVYRHPR